MIEPLTPTQYNRELTIRALKATLHNAITLNECYQKFWQREPAEIVASLNENVPQSMARFQENSALGTALNAALEHAGESLRVVVSMPDGYGFSNGAFTYTAPIIEPKPEPTEP